MENTVEADTVLGRFILPQGPDAVVRSLETLGEWAQEEIELLCKFLAPGDVVYDIGAFIGTHTRAFSRAVGAGGKVIGFEASPSNFEFYLANRDLAPLANIEAVNKAVGDHLGEVDIGSFSPDHAGTKSLQVGVEGVGEHVEMITLDAAGFPAPSLVKIDVEGAELQVLRGALELLKARRPVIFAETNRIEGSAEVTRLARDLGYDIYGTIYHAYREENFNNHPEDIFFGGVECGLLMVPKEKVDEHADVIAPLARIESDDDLALLLINKPQFTEEVLLHLASAEALDVPTIDVGPVKLKDQIEQIQARHDTLVDTYRKLEADFFQMRDQRDQFKAQLNELSAHLAQLGDLEATNKELMKRSRQDMARLERLKQETGMTIEAANQTILAAKKLSRAAQKQPFKLYFKNRKKYLRILRRIDRHQLPQRMTLVSGTSEFGIDRQDYALIKANFDPVFYRARYGRSLNEKCDLVAHYMTEGWRRSFDPSPEFSTHFYLKANPRVAECGVVPFAHFLREGRQSGRLGKHPAGFRGEILGDLQPIEDGAVRAEVTYVTERMRPGILKKLAGDGGTRLVVSTSHDDFTTVVGGTQLCIQRENDVAQAHNIHYLNLNPKKILDGLAPESDGADVEMSAVLDGHKIGLCNYREIFGELRAYAEAGGEARFVLHHLMGHAPEQVVEMVRAAGQDEAWVWLHDFFTLCPGYNLLRNTVSFCNAPPVGSPGCTICRFGETRAAHLHRVGTIFRALSVHLVAPSQVTADLWTSKDLHPVASVHVAPHVALEWQPRAETLPVAEEDPIRIGFLGWPGTHKGWDAFADVFAELQDRPEFEFLYLGNSAITATMECRHVEVNSETPNAMIDAVRDAKLDLVVHFAMWPETFSLTTFEALAGGAGVLTNPDSGNVAAKVAETGLGAVLDSYDALRAFLTSGDAGRLVSKLRARRARETVIYELSDMTIPFVSGTFVQ